MCKAFSFFTRYWKVFASIALAVMAVCSVICTVFLAIGSLRLHYLKPAPEDGEVWVNRLHASAQDPASGK